jgi:hypothetical protein
MVLTPKKWDTSLGGRFDPTDWYDIFRHHTFVKPAERHNFFHLVQTSKAISKEARETFFKSHHFVFETRHALHAFLDIIGDNSKYITSMSLHMSNSRVRLTDDMCMKFNDWQSRILHHRSNFLQTINKISGACPELVYFELLLCDAHYYDDRNDVRKLHCTQQPWVEALCMLHVKNFAFCQPSQGSYHRSRSLLEKEWKEEKEIERYVNDWVQRPVESNISTLVRGPFGMNISSKKASTDTSGLL